MISIDIIRNEPDRLRDSLNKRGAKRKIPWIKKIQEWDENWRNKIQKLNEYRRRKNELNKKIVEYKKEGKKCDAEIKDSKRLDININELEKKVDKLKKKIDEYLRRFPNILHESVPKGAGEEDNVPIKFWGKPIVWKEHLGIFKRFSKDVSPKQIAWKPLDHQELCEKWGLLDIKRAAKISGSRFYFMKKELVILNMSLMRFAMDLMVKKGFTPIYPPFMIRKEPEQGVTSMDVFEEMIYKVGDDLYMIPTSEHPMVSMHMNEVLNPGKLPLKYAGISTCFRKEAGSHGRDTKGIFRVHQFDKIEQVVICKPEDSWMWHEKLLANIEEIFKRLKIPYRIVNVCTGDIGMVGAKQYDLEAWLPGQGKYREMGSCSNCTDWQSQRLNMRYFEPNGKRRYVHTLNATSIATQRAMIAIMENNQDKKGRIKIPRALRKYTGFSRIG